MGHAIEEAVYAPLYFGYGGKDSQAPFRSAADEAVRLLIRIGLGLGSMGS